MIDGRIFLREKPRAISNFSSFLIVYATGSGIEHAA